ncbi:MAG: hypothetical protein Q9222_000556 [Ikaeria aurantiellina]
MASNDPSRRASVASSSDVSLVDPAVASKVLPKKEKPSGTIRLKKSIAKNAKPKDSDSKAETRTPSPGSPSVNDNDTESRASAPASQPGDDSAQMFRCKHCKKPVQKTLMSSHTKICPEKKNKDKVLKKKDGKDGKETPVKAGPGDEDKEGEAKADDSPAAKANGGEVVAGTDGIATAKGVIKSSKKSAAKGTTAAGNDNSSKKTKKRKAEAEGDKEPKKKKLKKDEPPKPKMPKPKGPVDVEKQCGVLLPNGSYCARSLTCKSHSMGAKRAVPGRSMPYDFLLAQYQKKNQAKQQKAAMDANAPLADDVDANAPVDSDEEKDAVMAAMARSRPQPIAQHIPISLRSKHKRIRVKEAIRQALAGNPNLFAIRPPEPPGAAQVIAASTAGAPVVEGGSVVESPVGVGPGMGINMVGGQNEGAGAGGGSIERRPSVSQQAAAVSATARGSSSVERGVSSEGLVRKPSVSATPA